MKFQFLTISVVLFAGCCKEKERVVVIPRQTEPCELTVIVTDVETGDPVGGTHVEIGAVYKGSPLGLFHEQTDHKGFIKFRVPELTTITDANIWIDVPGWVRICEHCNRSERGYEREVIQLLADGGQETIGIKVRKEDWYAKYLSNQEPAAR